MIAYYIIYIIYNSSNTGNSHRIYTLILEISFQQLAIVKSLVPIFSQSHGWLFNVLFRFARCRQTRFLGLQCKSKLLMDVPWLNKDMGQNDPPQTWDGLFHILANLETHRSPLSHLIIFGMGKTWDDFLIFFIWILVSRFIRDGHRCTLGGHRLGQGSLSIR